MGAVSSSSRQRRHRTTREPVPGTVAWNGFMPQQEIQLLKECYETHIKLIEDMHQKEKNLWTKATTELKNDVRRLKISNMKLKKSQQAATKKQEDLQNYLEAVKVKERSLRDDKEALEIRHGEEKRILVQRNKQLKNVMRALKIRNNKLKKDLEERMQMEETLKEELLTVREQHDSEMKMVQELHSREKRGWTKTNKTMKIDIRALKISNTKLKKRHESMLKKEEELQKELKAVKIANDRLHHLMECHDDEKEILRKKNLELQEELQAMKTRVAANNVQFIGSGSELQGHQCGAEPAERGEMKLSLDNFKSIKMLGRGAFGTVVLAKWKLPSGREQLCAVKALKKNRLTRIEQISHTIAEKEALILASGHPFITSLYSCFQNKDHLFFVMEYVSGGDLGGLLDEVGGVFSEKRTQFYAAEIALALEFLHKHGILHRDLKLENVLVGSDGHCKIADLGLTRLGVFGGDKTRSYVGTLMYMAPEIMQELPYGHAVDWWSLGVMVFEMLVGHLPFDVDDAEDGSNGSEILEQKIINTEVDFPEGLSPAAVSVVSMLLKKDPAERLGTCGSAKTVRQHCFFRGIDWQALLEKRVDPPVKPEVAEVPEEDWKEFNDLLKPDDMPCVISQALFEGFSYVNYRV